jgi:hypothetical protein
MGKFRYLFIDEEGGLVGGTNDEGLKDHLAFNVAGTVIDTHSDTCAIAQLDPADFDYEEDEEDEDEGEG